MEASIGCSWRSALESALVWQVGVASASQRLVHPGSLIRRARSLDRLNGEGCSCSSNSQTRARSGEFRSECGEIRRSYWPGKIQHACGVGHHIPVSCFILHPSSLHQAEGFLWGLPDTNALRGDICTRLVRAWTTVPFVVRHRRRRLIPRKYRLDPSADLVRSLSHIREKLRLPST
jgi:hypothetical protein